MCKSSSQNEFDVLKNWMLNRPGEDGVKPRGFTEVPEEFDARVLELRDQLVEISRKLDGGRILVVTHSHIIKSTFENVVREGQTKDISPANAQLFVTDYDYTLNM